MTKRIFDLLLASIGLLILFPFLLIIAALIKFDSKGPVIYKGKRVGKNEKEFDFYKFRTMHPNSDNLYITIGEKDPRITKIGYYLRKYKLDELPQLFNVIKGEISIVGPRPDVEFYKNYYKNCYKNYYKVKPGITCYSSIYFSDESILYESIENPEKIYIESTIPKKVELDINYFNNISILSDMKIIFLTLKKIFAKRI